MIVALGAVSLATPFLEGKYYQRWFVWPGYLVTVPMPLLVAGAALMAWRAIRAGHDAAPFLWTLALFRPGDGGAGGVDLARRHPRSRHHLAGRRPHTAASCSCSTGAVVMVPIILAYTAWSYWVFRGKVGEDGYH